MLEEKVDKESLPLITMVSPCFNHGKYVIESLNSIKNQTYPNIHHLIIDDCSTDDSVRLIEKWIDENNYLCTFVKHRNNKGISYTMNESIEMMKGEYWTGVCTDDFVVPERTEKFYNYLTRHPDVGMVVSDMMMVDENGNAIERSGSSSFLRHFTRFRENFSMDHFGSYDSLLFGNYIPSSIMVKKEVFIEAGKYSENLKMEDWEMWLRVSRLHRIGLIDEFLACYRFHETNSINDHKAISKNTIETLVKQKSYCYQTPREKLLYKKAYRHFFKHYFSISNPSSVNRAFLSKGNFILFLSTITEVIISSLFKKNGRLPNQNN